MKKTQQSDRTYRTIPPMTGDQLRRARRALGETWGLGRAVSHLEMAEMLGLSSKDQYARLERQGERITGPISAAVRAWLGGSKPANAPDREGWKVDPITEDEAIASYRENSSHRFNISPHEHRDEPLRSAVMLRGLRISDEETVWLESFATARKCIICGVGFEIGEKPLAWGQGIAHGTCVRAETDTE